MRRRQPPSWGAWCGDRQVGGGAAAWRAAEGSRWWMWVVAVVAAMGQQVAMEQLGSCSGAHGGQNGGKGCSAVGHGTLRRGDQGRGT